MKSISRLIVWTIVVLVIATSALAQTPTPQPVKDIAVNITVLRDGRYLAASHVELYRLNEYWGVGFFQNGAGTCEGLVGQQCANPGVTRIDHTFVWDWTTGQYVKAKLTPGDYQVVAYGKDGRTLGRTYWFKILQGEAFTTVSIETPPAAVTRLLGLQIDNQGNIFWTVQIDNTLDAVVVESYLEGPTRTSSWDSRLVDTFVLRTSGTDIRLDRSRLLPFGTPRGYYQWIKVVLRDPATGDPLSTYSDGRPFEQPPVR